MLPTTSQYDHSYSSCSVLKFDGIWILFNLATQEGQERKGSATALIRIVQEAFRKSEDTLLCARTIQGNIPYRIFKRLGFTDAGMNDKQHVIQIYAQA